jgi:hypothetical protein
LGRESLPNGTVYVGEFVKGNRCGKGVETTCDKFTRKDFTSIAIGDVSGTDFGVRFFPDASGYVGEFSNDGKMHGAGKYIWSQDEYYEGRFEDGLFHGDGKMVSPERTYIGQFKCGKFDGKGEWKGKDGMHYVGDWKDGACNGKGASKSPEGNTYVGDFVDDKYHGKGTMFFGPGAHKGDSYSGDFFQGEQTGQGVYKWANQNKYTGPFIGGKCHGHGVLEYHNGGKYEGQFENSVQTAGKFTDKYGNVYEGKFANQEITVGKCTYKNGTVYQGKFANYQPHDKNGKEISPDGSSYVGGFENGLKHGTGTITNWDGQKLGVLFVKDKPVKFFKK